MSSRKPAEDRKREIVQTAMQLAFSVGPDQVTTGLVAAKMGVSQPAIYKHFPSKNDIWATVAQHLCERITQNITRAEDPTRTPIERIKQLVLSHLKLVNDHPALPKFIVMQDAKHDQSGLRPKIQSTMEAFHAALERDVTAAIKDGTFRPNTDPKDATTLILGVIQSLVLRMMVTQNPTILTRDGERLLDLQISGFATTGDNP